MNNFSPAHYSYCIQSDFQSLYISSVSGIRLKEHRLRNEKREHLDKRYDLPWRGLQTALSMVYGCA